MPTQPYLLANGKRVPGVTTVLGKRKDPGGLIHWAWQVGCAGLEEAKGVASAALAGDAGAHKAALEAVMAVPETSYRKKRDDAADAGTLAHAMVEEHIHGRDPMALINQGKFANIGKDYSTDPEVIELAKTAFGSYLRWEGQCGIAIEETEMPMVSEAHLFGGCPDAVGRMGDELILLDWKTSNKVYADHLIQLSAYRELWNEVRDESIEEAHLLRFGKEHGDFRHYQFTSAQLDVGWAAFLRLREVYELDKTLSKMT